jgi:hypothetical protein
MVISFIPSFHPALAYCKIFQVKYMGLNIYYVMNLLVVNVVKIIQNMHICYEAKPYVKTSAPVIRKTAVFHRMWYCGNKQHTNSPYILPVSKT